MNYNSEFWQSIKRRLKEDRQNYLDLCNVKEEEIKKDRFGQEYFFFDGVIVYVPEYFKNPSRFKKYLVG